MRSKNRDFSDYEPESELIEIEKHYRKHTRMTTDKLPEDLPIEVVEHGPAGGGERLP